jgi:hypothetical protein
MGEDYEGIRESAQNVRPKQQRRGDPCVQPRYAKVCLAVYGSQPLRLKHADHRTTDKKHLLPKS